MKAGADYLRVYLRVYLVARCERVRRASVRSAAARLAAWILPVLAATVVSACTTSPGEHAPADELTLRGESMGVCGERYPMAVGLELAVVADYFEQQRYRSALAHLEELDLEHVDARIMQADALRAIGDLDGSNRVYMQLVSSCLTARAYQGLALNAFEIRDVQLALRYMAQARRARPTDASIRNDLGYLLLLDGQYREAEQELLTALELDRRHSSAAQNLALLYLHRGDQAQAERIAETYSIRSAAFAALRDRVGLLAQSEQR